MKSARRSFTQRMAGVAAADTRASGEKDNRPPLYVPTKREPVIGNQRLSMKDTSLNAAQASGYQPKTSFGYVPSAEIAQKQKQQAPLFNVHQSMNSMSGSMAGSSRGFGVKEPDQMTSAVLDNVSRAKPPKPKMMAPPPVATF